MRILIVEDDADSGEALMLLLEDLGYEVRWVSSPFLASPVSAEFRPQVAILDIGMPMMSGYELIEVLRALPGLANCRYLAVTAYAGVEFANRSKAAGFTHHLVKPLQFDKLLECLESSSSGEGGAPAP